MVFASENIGHEPREIRFPQAAIGWAALILLLLSALAYGAVLPVAWTLLSMVTLGLFALQILLDLIQGFPKSASRVAAPAILYLGALGWGVAQIWPGLAPEYNHPVWVFVPDQLGAMSGDPLSGSHVLMRLSTYAMLFWIAVRAAARSERAFAFLILIALYGTALATFGLVAWSSGSNPILGDAASDVVSASFVNRNNYATYAVMGAIANLAVYLRLAGDTGVDEDGRRALRNFLERFYSGAWLFAVGLLLSLGALFLTQSRAGGVAGFLGLGSFFLIYRRKSPTANLFLTVSLAAILAFVAIVLTSGFLTRVLATSEEAARFVLYPIIIDGIEERPWLGHGLGAFHDTFRARVPLEISNAEWSLAHSSFLENIYEFGIPAAVAFYLALTWIAFVVLRGALQRRRNRTFSCAAFAVLVATAFHSVFDFSLQMPATAALFAFLLGMGWTQSFRHQRHIPR